MGLYRVLMLLALPFLVLGVALRRLRGRGAPGELPERLGFVAPLRGRVLWLHGASNGEITSARALIDAVLAGDPGLSVLLTANSASGRAMVRGWGNPRIAAAFAPFDTGGAVARLMARAAPRALVIVENELWPVRIAAVAGARVPVLVVGARLSARSAARWGRLRRLTHGMLGRLAFVSAQDAASADRLLALGLPPDRLGPPCVLKAAAASTPLPAPFALPHPRARILLAASTHPGEEAMILDAFKAAAAFDLLILAPRHPRRAAAVAAEVAARGLPLARRSLGQVPGAETAVYLADTLGEMPMWYAMAGVTVIGGTLVEKGGHTPFEPAAFGSALVHGPSVANFADVFARLDAGDGAVAVADGVTLAAALRRLDAGAQERMAAAAGAVLAVTDDQGALVAAVLRAIARDG